MIKLNRCESCKGSKKLLMLGGMTKECPSCRGIGWLESDDEVSKIADAMNANGNVVKVKKKPGRKPKINHEQMLNV